MAKGSILVNGLGLLEAGAPYIGSDGFRDLDVCKVRQLIRFFAAIGEKRLKIALPWQ